MTRFYTACEEAVQKLLTVLDEETTMCIVGEEHTKLLNYYLELDPLIQKYCLKDNPYLCNALRTLDLQEEEDRSLFLIEFLYVYLRLHQSNLL